MQDLYIQAEAFISSMQQFERTKLKGNELTKRLEEIKQSIKTTGTYFHTKEELDFGAKLAWRNSNRCVGRHFWRQLDVFDCRKLYDASSVFKALEHHIEHAFNNGTIKSTITIFAPRNPSKQTTDRVRILNHQLIRYAGFENIDKTILGDPHSKSLTKALLSNGWRPKYKTAFTPMPWWIEINGKKIEPYTIFESKAHLLHEVKLEHPDNKRFNQLDLKWYSMPILSDMALVIGGIIYPCAPFNGWYMGTEIGARNLADEERYNYLPKIAEVFKLDKKDDRTLWRDRAIVELNRAILYSFDRDHVRIGDHHNITRQFEKFCENEEKAQCPITGDWSWLVPPISASQTPTFYQEFDPNVVKHTNFFYQKDLSESENLGEQTKNASKQSKCPYHLN